MKIIKKKGNKEEYDFSKVKQSIISAAGTIGQSLTDADMKIIESEIKKVLSTLKREETSSYEIFGIIINILSGLNFSSVAKAYVDGALN